MTPRTLELGPSIKLAWKRIKGFKITAWMSAALMMFIPILFMGIPLVFGTSMVKVSEIDKTISVMTSPSDYPTIELIFMVGCELIGVISLLVLIGNLLMQGVRNVRNGHASVVDAITQFTRPLQVCIGFVIFLSVVGGGNYVVEQFIELLIRHASTTQLPWVTGLKIILGLAVALSSILFLFFPCLIIDKKRGIFAAFRESVQTTWHFKGRVFVLFGLCLFLQYSLLIPIMIWQSQWMLLVAFISNIWFLPFFLNVYGVIYQRLFE
jgi:hypothetical protein